MKFYLIIALSLVIASCQRQVLFQAKENMEIERSIHDSINRYRVIQVDDKLSLSIWNHDDISIGSIYGIYNSNEVYGKWILVDSAGCINLPLIGIIKINGLTIKEAENKLKEELGKYIQSPIITLRILNRKVTVLGEVIKPGNYLLEEEKNQLTEVIAEAGGFDYYANKRRIKIIRIENGITKTRNVKLTNLNSLDNNNGLVVGGDIVYIPPTSSKIIDKKVQTLMPVASLVTASILLIKLLSGGL